MTGLGHDAVREGPIHVPMGALAVSRNGAPLTIRGLGSCIALAFHDPESRIGGLAHTVIPRPLPRELRGPAWATSEAPARLLDAMIAAGASRERVHARIAGGASMFTAARRSFNVGAENARAVEAALTDLGIPLLSRRVGGHWSRNVSLDPATGRFVVEDGAAMPGAAPRARPRARVEEARDELASVLLNAALAPLATVLEQTVEVQDARAYEMPVAELEPFLGGPDSVVWVGRSTMSWNGKSSPLAIFIPDAHARALAAAVRGFSETQEPDDVVLAEVMNFMTSHLVTSVARLHGARIATPDPPVASPLPVATALRDFAALMGPRGNALALYGRAYAERVLRGADTAIVLPSDAAPFMREAALPPHR